MPEGESICGRSMHASAAPMLQASAILKLHAVAAPVLHVAAAVVLHAFALRSATQYMRGYALQLQHSFVSSLVGLAPAAGGWIMCCYTSLLLLHATCSARVCCYAQRCCRVWGRAVHATGSALQLICEIISHPRLPKWL